MKRRRRTEVWANSWPTSAMPRCSPGLSGIAEFILKLSLPELRWAMKYKVCKSDESRGARISTIELGRGVPIVPQTRERIPKFPVGLCWLLVLLLYSWRPSSDKVRYGNSVDSLLLPLHFTSQSVFHSICSVLDLQVQHEMTKGVKSEHRTLPSPFSILRRKRTMFWRKHLFVPYSVSNRI